MRFVFSPFAGSSNSAAHHSRRFILRYPLSLIALLSLATLLAIAIAGPSTSIAASSFTPKQDFGTGSNPRAIAVTDINLDGKPDLVVPNVNSNSVSVLLSTISPGAIDSSFTGKQDFAVGAGPVSVAVGDLNGDGKPDIVVANFNSNNVSVLLNKTLPGSTTVNFAAKQDVATSQGPIYVTAGDLDGDGKLDLAVVNLTVNSISLLLNTTEPGAAAISFAAKQDFDTGVSPLSVALGDLNGDGKLDLAVSSFSLSSISVLLNTTAPGSVTLTFSNIQDFATGDSVAFVAIGDLNGDGKLDLAVANFSVDTVSVLFNTTATGALTASFAPEKEFATGVGPIFVTVGDIDNDGRLDLLVADFNSAVVSVLLNNTVTGQATPSFATKQDFTTGDAPLFVGVNDLNGDGKLDLAVANLNVSTVSVLLNSTARGPATPGFALKQDVDTGLNPRSIAVGDLNGDGKPDLAISSVSSNSVSVLLNTTIPGANSSSFTVKKDFAVGTNPVSVAAIDINRDGKLDLVAANISSNTVSVLLNTTASGATSPSFAVKQDIATSNGPLSVSANDLNGDGKLDLVVVNQVSSVSVFVNNTATAATTVAFAPKQDFPTGDGPRFVSVGDLNLDGRLDLAIANSNSNTVAVLLNTTRPGDAAISFAPIHDFPTGVRPLSVSVADLNGDGKLDLATTNFVGNTVSVLLNSGLPGAATPSFQTKLDFTTNFNPSSVTVGDLNGDGKLDLAVANSHSDNISVFQNTAFPGDRVPAFTKQDFATGDSPIFVTKGDFNGDGRFDLVAVNVDLNTASILLNEPTLETAAGFSLQKGSTSRNAQIARVTNYTGDGGLSLRVTSPNPANGVAISNIINSDGNVTADIVASCGATTATFTLEAADGNTKVSNTLSINVTANTAPTLTYQNQNVGVGKSLQVNPGTGPLDNGTVSVVKQSSGTYTGTISVNATTGVVSFDNAAPAGVHTITIRATDNCGVSTDASFTLTVGKESQAITFGPLPNKNVGDPDFGLIATASSGLPVTFVANGQCSLVGNNVHLTGAGLCTITASQLGDANFSPAPNVVQSFNITNPALISLSQANYNANESIGVVTITVNRTGDLSTTIKVDYATDDTGSSNVCSKLNSGLASARCDFGLTLGTLTFAPNETQKTFVIPITQDSYTEGPETFTVNLFKPKFGVGFLPPSSATVTIRDSVSTAPNANDDTQAFVRQQYRDFLNRDADPAGLAFWSGEINNCTPKPDCTEPRRVNVSAAFFLSREFQETGNLVRSVYVAALNRSFAGQLPAFDEFERDTQAVQRGVVIGEPNAEQILSANRDAFLRDFVTRSEFLDLYPTAITPAQYVDDLCRHAEIVPTAAERTAALGEFGGAATASDDGARGRALFDLIQNEGFQERQVIPSFVQMQYFGYLRRNPNDLPDVDFSGFDFWVGKLDQFGGNFVDADMVKSFLVSLEYRQRFGP